MAFLVCHRVLQVRRRRRRRRAGSVFCIFKEFLGRLLIDSTLPPPVTHPNDGNAFQHDCHPPRNVDGSPTSLMALAACEKGLEEVPPFDVRAHHFDLDHRCLCSQERE